MYLPELVVWPRECYFSICTIDAVFINCRYKLVDSILQPHPLCTVGRSNYFVQLNTDQKMYQNDYNLVLIESPMLITTIIKTSEVLSNELCY